MLASLLAALPIAATAQSAQFDLNLSDGALLPCLERVALAAHVRIVDRSGATAARCAPLHGRYDVDGALHALLDGQNLGWLREKDGTVVIVPAVPMRLDLQTLAVEGNPLPANPRPRGPAATPLVENASALTRIDHTWLDTAPLLGLSQIGRFAPNVYGSGQSLAMRGLARDSDYFTALTVSLDGIDLGTRLLDDDLVPLDGLDQIDIARGPRAFESGGASAGGSVRLYSTPTAAEAMARSSLGLGNEGAWRASSYWSGPLADSGLGMTLALQRRALPVDVEQRGDPTANLSQRRNDGSRINLSYLPDSMPGLSAQMSLLAVNGNNGDRWVLHEPRERIEDRDNSFTAPLLTTTQGRGGAASVRLQPTAGPSVEAYVSGTHIQYAMRAPSIPNQQYIDYEQRRRAGANAQWTWDAAWHLAMGLEAAAFDTRQRSELDYPSISRTSSDFGTRTRSGWTWIEHDANAWKTGLGWRWLREDEITHALVNASDRRGRQVRTLPLPLASVQWQFLPQHSLTLSEGRAYRSGGSRSETVGYAPELERNTELAWQSGWLQEHVQARVSLFHATSSDRYFAAGQLYAGNRIRTRQRGAEMEMEAGFGERWHARAGFGWLDARYSRYLSFTGDFTGLHLPAAPAHTAALGLRYGAGAGFYASADAYHAGAAQGDDVSSDVPNQRDLLRHAPYSLLDLRVGYRWTKWDLTCIGTNVADALYIDRASIVPPHHTLPAGSMLQFGDPRRLELRLSREW
jgi:outer membrane receptor protein involved in Fe transport